MELNTHVNETFRQALRVRYITYTPLDFVLKEKGSKTCISCSHYYQNWTQFFFVWRSNHHDAGVIFSVVLYFRAIFKERTMLFSAKILVRNPKRYQVFENKFRSNDARIKIHLCCSQMGAWD
jgi:hypothetical protein